MLCAPISTTTLVFLVGSFVVALVVNAAGTVDDDLLAISIVFGCDLSFSSW